MRGSDKIRLLQRANYFLDDMEKKFDQICGPNKVFDSRYDTLLRMRRYVDGKLKAKEPFSEFNYKPDEPEELTSTKLLGFLDNMESQFWKVCQEKTEYVLDGETNGVDCRYQIVTELRDKIIESLNDNNLPTIIHYSFEPRKVETEEKSIAA